MAVAPEIHIFHDQEELATEAADLFLWLANQAIAARQRFVVALSGGSTPKTVYRALASAGSKVDWSKVIFCFGDERCVPPSHEESNFLTARTSLFQPLNIPETQVLRMIGEQGPERASHDYETLLRRTLEVLPDGWPRFDLIFLGVGQDGHTASLFPGTAALREHTRWVVPGLAPTGIRERVTVTLNVIDHADVVVFLVAGAGKAGIVREILEPTLSRTDPYPASLVHPRTGRLLWYLDGAAASDLSISKRSLSSREE
jgi:6-phosphogluconolactonase